MVAVKLYLCIFCSVALALLKVVWPLNNYLSVYELEIVGDKKEKFELVLEGGAAFGTGDHPTTRLCCSWLQSSIAESGVAETSVLDYGCGSAILGHFSK